MPHKISIGLSRKDGLPQFGSIGASCHIEFEIDTDPLGNDLEGFHRSVSDAFTACRQAVHDELSRYKQQNGVQPALTSQQQAVPANGNGNGSANGRGHDQQPGNGSSRAATPKQLTYAKQLANQIDALGSRKLESLVRSMFQVAVAELTSLQASELIDRLKEIKSGSAELPPELQGAAR